MSDVKVHRFYAEKRPGFDTEARLTLAGIRENFGRAEGLRILVRYDAEGLTDKDAAARTVFSEPPSDFVYEDDFPLAANETAFCVSYLPGQYDQRADGARQCLALIGQDAEVRCAKVYVISGADAEAVKKVKAYLINPVDSREETDWAKPETLSRDYPEAPPERVSEGFTALRDTEIAAFGADYAMSAEDLLFVRDYFRDELRRNPTETELKVLDTYWSDHCRHTTFGAEITAAEIRPAAVRETYERFLRENPGVKLTLMNVATAAGRKIDIPDLDESEEINACSIKTVINVDGLPREYLVMFKNETHNHPTEIEPFGGAATCLGGAIRDPLSGRAYVYQSVRVTGAAEPTEPVSATINGKLPQKRITEQAAHGFSSYGNQIGIATGLVREIYDEGYKAKRMEIGAVVGAVPAENVVRERPAPGDAVLLVGGRTGRDGCGGATGSSKEHDEQSLASCGAEVQKGNPVTERKLQRLFRNPKAARLIKRCNDFGAGGVSVAVGELAESLDIDLDAVLRKYEGLSGTELAISESQERMAVVVAPGDAELFAGLCAEENLECSRVASVTDDGFLRMRRRGAAIVEIPRKFLDTNGAPQFTRAVVGDIRENPLRCEDFSVEELLKRPNVRAQTGLIERFDSTIGANTVLFPLGGEYRKTPCEVTAMKIPVAGETNAATVMSFGFDPEISKISPFHGAVWAVVESLAKIAASGADWRGARLTLQEYFPKPSTDEKRGLPLAALLGAYLAQVETGIPAIGGKDSMSGTFRDLDVPPTLVSFALAVSDARYLVSPEFKRRGSYVALAEVPVLPDGLPDFPALKTLYDRIYKLIKEGKVSAARACGRYGAIECAALMSFGNKIGFMPRDGFDFNAPLPGSLVLEFPNGADVPEDFRSIGVTLRDKKAFGINIDELIDIWEEPLSGVFPVRGKYGHAPAPEREPDVYEAPAPAITHIRNPRAFIPVFPGTNCEYDSERAFKRAGADTDAFVFRNLTVKDAEDSARETARRIDKAQILMLPGGFSAGDEPDGSAKFITAVLRNPAVRDAVHALIGRGGLVLGICNGFQALLKSGLLTCGEIREQTPDAPTLTFNAIGRHVSAIVRTKAESVNSPWLAGIRPGDIHNVPVSHGEGRFVCADEYAEKLFAGGRVAFTYYGDNPNGSVRGIEGIISPDGRVLGKMGHSERVGRELYKNIPGGFDQRIFESGVQYIRNTEVH